MQHTERISPGGIIPAYRCLAGCLSEIIEIFVFQTL